MINGGEDRTEMTTFDKWMASLVALAFILFVIRISTKSSMKNPAELLEKAYLDSASFLEKTYYNLLSEEAKRSKIAEFSSKNPEVVKDILKNL